MRIFISMAMKDKSREEIIKKRDEVFQQIKSTRLPEAELIDSVLDISADLPDGVKDVGDNRAMYYLALSIQLMATADIVFFVDECQYNSRGCRRELDIATAYNKITHNIITQEYKDNNNRELKSIGLTTGKCLSSN